MRAEQLMVLCLLLSLDEDLLFFEPTLIPEHRLGLMSGRDVETTVGSHRHKCPKCFGVWAHSDLNAGSNEAHLCPNCGFGPIWNRHYGS